MVGIAAGRRTSSGSIGKPIVSRVRCGRRAGIVSMACVTKTWTSSEEEVSDLMMAEAPGVCGGIAVGPFVGHKRCKDMNVDVPVVCGDIG